MAKMIDTKPSYKGESIVWDSLDKYLPSDFVVYNQREINGREYDFCIMAENLGVVIIEVKGWVSDKITVNGVDNIIIEGYDKAQTSPKKQARAYRFAVLNKISEKYNASPLVMDMVCYPFISEKEYHDCKLDIISEPQYTIFKEDLENQELINNKILNVFHINRNIPHSDFSYELMFRIRRSLEPDIKEIVNDSNVIPYSLLYLLFNEIDENKLEEIFDLYFAGVKSIIFVNKLSEYEKVLQRLNSELKKRNIDYKKDNLYLGYEDGVERVQDKHYFRIFAFEIYYICDLDTQNHNNVVIREGALDKNTRSILNEISRKTTFNMQQYEVEHATTEKNLLIEAGAGTGKTFSMVSRVAFLCNKEKEAVTNISDEIAMVTFTNDAAINMKKRLKQMFVNYFVLTGKEKYLKFVEDIDRSNISTIHSFAIKIMRGESLYTGLGTNFRIRENEYYRGKAYDRFLGDFLENMENNNPNFLNEIPVPVYELKKKLMDIAGKLLNKSVDFERIKKSEMGTTIDNNIPYFNELITQVVFPAEALYIEGLKNVNDIDLKESLIELNRIFSKGCSVIEELKIRFMFIDEFQDTDDVQIELFSKIQKCINADCKLFVVGDLKQSIYRFRGAKLNAFQKLQNGKEEEWGHYHLNRNYRTDNRLLSLYDEIFKKMGNKNILPYSGEEDSLSSDVLSDADEDDIFVELPCHARKDEALQELLCDTISNEIEKISSLMKKKELKKEERTIAILVRSNWQIENIIKATSKRDINVEISSGGDLFQLPSTLDLYKLVLALCNNTNPIYLVNLIESNNTDLHLDYQRIRFMSDMEKLNALTKVLDALFMEKMNKTWNMVLDEVFSQPILFALKMIVDALKPWDNYTNIFEKKKNYIANYEYLLEKIIKYARIDSLTLNQIANYLSINILSGQQELSRSTDIDDKGIHVICTTVHKSKGLEYGTVIIPYTFEDISNTKNARLEANYSDNSLSYTVMFDKGIRERNSNYSEEKEVNEQISEEARILYVALTRAIRKCIWINNIDSKPVISWGTLLEG